MASNNMSPLRNFLNSIKSSVYNISIDGINSVDKNASNLFFNFPNLYRAISLNDMNYITNMYNMFSGCYNLINISNFNTSKVINMSCMFDDCQKLTTAPNFDTSNVTDMYGIFGGCWNLTTVPNFNTSKVINMNRMFFGCRNLTTVPNFNTSKVINMGAMFQGCNSLIVPNFNTINVINMANMFYRCNNLSQVSVNNIVTSCSTATKVTNKNWTNIGFNVAEGSKWNTWIRTAPNYMNAVNIGWQNIGEAILPAYKRRIMVGDNLYNGQNIYYNNIYDLQWYLNRCNTIPLMETQNIIETNISNRSIFEENYDEEYLIEHNLDYNDNTTEFWIDTFDGSELIVYNSRNIEMDVTVTNIIESPIYRQLYIEDENIRPIQEGDVIGPGTKLYFVIPDDAYIKDSDELFLGGGKDWPFALDSANLCGFSLSSGAGYHSSLIVQTGSYSAEAIYAGSEQDGLDYNESYFEWPSDGKIYIFQSYTNETLFDAWVNSKYILVDKRTLYRNPEVGDNLRNRTFYFTLPDDIYTSDNFDWAYSCNDESIDLYFTYYATKFTWNEKVIAYTYPDWNHNDLLICYHDEEVNNWSSYSQPHLYSYEEPNVTSNIKLWKTISNQDLIVTSINETSDFYKNIFIKEQEDEYTLEEQALNLARLYYFDINRPASANFSVATTRGEDVFVIQVTKNAAVQMWLTVNTTLGVVLEGSSNPTNEDYALALAEKYYKENYGNDTVYYGVATQKSETEFVIQVTQNAAVLMFLNVNVSTGEVTER